MAEVAMTVAEGFVAPMIEKMIKKVPSYLGSLRNWQRDVDDDVKKLRLALAENLAMLTTAQQQHTRDDTLVEQWVLQIKDAIYDAEDVLDEFEYRGLKARADRSRSPVSRTFSCSLTLAKRLIGLDDFRTTLKKMLQRLKEAHDNIMSLSQTVHLVPKTEVDPTRVTSPIEPAHEIFGRHKEREEIVTMLLKPVDEPESSSSRKCIPVISIVGFGGLGKTTLARLLYNDSRIGNHFDTRIWVCVSDSFDKIRLTKDILESVSKADEKIEDVNNFQKLQKNLQAKLESKKFLLVLDDVWLNENMKDWENKESWDQVLGPLNQAAIGSKILVTTRMDRVADMFEETNRIPLEGLANDEYWLLFKSCAFGNAIPENHLELEQIGRDIATRLHGSPLAAKAMGSLLRDKLDVNEWKEILEKDMFDDIGSILNLSYQRLPDHLKPCFGYCSIFPKDWKFESEKLVVLWIAQGYVQPLITVAKSEHLNQMISKGKEYFNQLLFRSFFQKVEQDSDIYYVMHDLMHDLSQFVSKDECFRINTRKISPIPETVRHLGIIVENEDKLVNVLSQLEKSNLNKLRTLMFLGSRAIGFLKLSRCVFKDLRSLRVLDFGRLYLKELPGALDHLLHLRYLNLGYVNFGMLPKLLPELYHLQVLVGESMSQPFESMVRLIKYVRLVRFDTRELVYSVEKGRGHKIVVLKDLKKEFRGTLSIKNLENVSRKKDAIKADLGSKQDLDGLNLEWGLSSGRMNRRDTDKEVAEGLKPHQKLRVLGIYGFWGTRLPSWLETDWLISLTRIELSNCGCLQVLPPLGQLPCLEDLRIYSMHAIKRVTSEFYGHKNADKKGFPSLKSLSFREMPEWLEWYGVEEEFTIFPRLQKLTVLSSPKLMQLPPLLPPTIRHVSIRGTGLISSLELVETESSSSSEKYFLLERSVIPSFRDWMTDELLRATKYLEIRDSEGHMPAGGIVELAALKELRIDRCWELLASEEEDGPGVLPSSLESLSICGCHVTDRWLSRCLQGLTSLSELAIANCTGLTSLPSAQVLRSLTRLQKLKIRFCVELTSLGGLDALESLTHLKVENCPELKSLPEEGLPPSVQHLSLDKCDPALMQQMQEKKGPEEEDGPGVLPSSLESLSIRDCDVTDRWLSRCLQGLTSLSKLKICFCTGLTSLPSAQVLRSLTRLQKLKIRFCVKLTSLGGLHALESLTHLEVEFCPELKSLPEEGLQGLTSLSELKICFCTGLTSLPSAQVLRSLTRLQKLKIWFCVKLTSLGGLHALESLTHLEVDFCPELKSLPEEGLQGLTSLSELAITNCTGLTSLPSAQVLRSLTGLQKLTIRRCKKLTSLGGLHALESLTHLEVEYCPELKSLPEEGLPRSVQHLSLDECDPALMQQMGEKKGPEWDKVAHIPQVEFRLCSSESSISDHNSESSH